MESQWSTSSNVSEHLVEFINYSDFEEIGEMYRASQECSEAKGRQNPEAKVKKREAKTNVIHEALPRRKENSMCDATTSTYEHASAECNNKYTSSNADSLRKSSYADFPSFLPLNLEVVNCISMLELAKSNIVALIDNHIVTLRSKEQLIQKQQNEQINQLKLLVVRNSLKRQNCIQRIREELSTKTDHLNKLLDELMKIE